MQKGADKGENMTKYEYSDPGSAIALIQLADDHDLSVIESEVADIRKRAGDDFSLIVFKVDDWNRDLSPWQAPAVFGKEDFGGGASDTLKQVLSEIGKLKKRCYIGGYSLAGLFALWAAYQTDAFAGVAAASPSVWFPGFREYMRENEIRTGKVYLSLGDREEKARNPVMASVGDCIRQGYAWLQEKGVPCTLEWNEGNHFRDPDIRTAKAFAWVMQK